MGLIKFIINFVLFGALFYLIWHFFPDAFMTLVSWIKALVEYVQQLLTDLYYRIANGNFKKEIVEPAKTLLQMTFNFLN